MGRRAEHGRSDGDGGPAEPAGTAPRTAPRPVPWTATERRLAAAWAAELGTAPARIGRDDDFFALGGTSLSAVRLAVALDRVVSVRDLTAHPVLADLARLVDSRTRPGSASAPGHEPGSGPRHGPEGDPEDAP
ncbi:hypothetical protein DN402_08115 [Streptomyces sp. SW4]|nr:hypothetical protein DN402_08115 [Streptomyces sp. SW4]